MLLLLAACSLDNALEGEGEDPPPPGDSEADTGADTAADSGSGETGSGTGSDTGGDTGVDTGDTGDAPCADPGVMVPITVGGERLSPYATRFVADLDGRGRPDLLHEAWTHQRGIAVVYGEDVTREAATWAAWLAPQLGSSQAALVVGSADDLDGDGLREVLVGEGASDTEKAIVAVWSPADPSAPLATVELPGFDGGGYASPAPGPLPDIDGDGVGELFLSQTPQYGASTAYVLPGAIGGAASDRDAEVEIVGVGRLDPRATIAPDLDGDGLDDLLLTMEDDLGDEHLLGLPADALHPGVMLTGADLTAIVDYAADSKAPVARDTDGDGLPELYVLWSDASFHVLGFTGSGVQATVFGAPPLGPADARLRIDGEGRDYLGANLAFYGDAACGTGLVASAHFADALVFAPPDVLRDGGAWAAGDLPRWSGPEWYGYVLAGGGDLDGNGADDFIVGAVDGRSLELYLGPTAP